MSKELPFRLRLIVERREDLEDDEHHQYVKWHDAGGRTLLSSQDEKAIWDDFSAAIHKLLGGTLSPDVQEKLAPCIAWGLTQPEADALTDGHSRPLPTAVTNILTEIAHSMNRKGLLSNEQTEPFINLLKAAYVKGGR